MAPLRSSDPCRRSSVQTSNTCVALAPSHGRPQRASAPGTTDHRIKVETERTLSGVLWFIGFCDFSAVLRVRRACAGCHAEVSRFEQIRVCEKRWRHAVLFYLASVQPDQQVTSSAAQRKRRFLFAMLTASVTRARQCHTRAAARASERLLASGSRVYLVSARASLA